MKDDGESYREPISATGGSLTRRRLILALGAAFVLRGSSARAQARQLHRVAWLSGGRKADTAESFAALLDGLRDLEYREGDNLVVDARWADYVVERATQLAGELAALRPAVIVTQGAAHGPAVRLSPPLPVVFLHSGDPVEAGLAESFARPGRNATGISLLALDLIGKRMELLKQIVPSLRRVAFLANPEHPGEQRELAASRAAAAQLGIEVTYYRAIPPSSIPRWSPWPLRDRMEPYYSRMRSWSANARSWRRSFCSTGSRARRAGRTSPRAGICCHMDRTDARRGDAWHISLTRSSKARARRICRSNSRRSSKR